MTNRLLSLVPAAVLGGAVLLTACGQGGDAENPSNGTQQHPDQSGASQNSASPMTSATNGGQVRGDNAEEGDVNCGPTQTPSSSGTKYTLIADKTPDGIIGCTEAFNILAEYREAPQDPSGGSQHNKELSNGWSCATDGGSGSSAVGNVYCSNGEDDGHGGTTGGLELHTEAA